MKIVRWACRAEAAVPLALCIALIVFGIFAQPALIGQFVNSDSLLPVHMAWDVTTHDYAWSSFQWPRVPSLPDLAFFFSMELAGANWRASVLLYSCLVTAILIAGLGAVLSRMRGISLREGLFWAGLAVFVVLAVAIAFPAPPSSKLQHPLPQLYLLVPVTHGDAFLFSLFAGLTGIGAIRGDGRLRWTTWLICAVATFSDMLFIGYFVTPFTIAAFLLAWRYRGAAGAPSGRQIQLFLTGAIFGCLAGWFAKSPLLIQRMEVIYPGPATSLRLFLADLPHVPWMALLLALTFILSFRSLWVLRPAAGPSTPTVTQIDREWLALTGIGACLIGLILTTLFYDNSYAYRYAIPLAWWPLVIALSLIPLPGPGKLRGGVLVGAVVVGALLPLSLPVMAEWRTPLERCLAENRQKWGLEAGLATYWHSRAAMASSDWRLQLDQIDRNARAYMWGNNFAAYAHDMTVPERPPRYNYVIADRELGQATIEAAFGRASRYERCGELEVLIFENAVKPLNAIGDRSPPEVSPASN